MLLPEALESFIQEQEDFLDSFIEIGTEQELFAASYIHGHFSVVVAIELVSVDDSVTDAELDAKKVLFSKRLAESIEDAIENKELANEDADDVRAMLVKLSQVA